jgi:hypothetical protein
LAFCSSSPLLPLLPSLFTCEFHHSIINLQSINNFIQTALLCQF